MSPRFPHSLNQTPRVSLCDSDLEDSIVVEILSGASYMMALGIYEDRATVFRLLDSGLLVYGAEDLPCCRNSGDKIRYHK